MSLTPIQEFFKDKSVFVTGATGFLGSAVVEKLLRSCLIKKIFVLIREKKGVSQQPRYDKTLSSTYFDRAKKATPDYRDRIEIINGDLSEERLGLSQEIIDKLINELNYYFYWASGEQSRDVKRVALKAYFINNVITERTPMGVIACHVHVVIHCAATVRFDEPLKVATQLNVKALKFMIELSKQIRNLQSFVHISTCYCNCFLSGDVYEEIYDSLLPEPEEFIKYIDTTSDEILAEKESTIIKNYPNTYTFTKGIGESLVKREAGNLPICIVRPSIVMGCASEPIPGYGGENLFGPYAFMLGTAAGVIRVMISDPDIRFDIIPVDMTANGILAAAYKTAQTKKDYPDVYHLATSKQNPLTFHNFLHWTMCCTIMFPPSKPLWYPMALETKSVHAYHFYSFFLHTIPAYTLDASLKVLGYKPMFVKLYDKVYKGQMALRHFMTTSWIFHDDNTKEMFDALTEEDQKLFNFDTKEVDWIIYLMINCRNLRINIMKDPMSTLRTGIRKRFIKDSIDVYHIATSARNPLLFYNFLYWTFATSYVFPPSKSLWNPTLFSTKCEYAYNFYSFFLHTVPGYVLDAARKVMGKKPMFVKLYEKAHKGQAAFKYFLTTSWIFHDNNTLEMYKSLTEQDQQLFNFDTQKIDWIIYLVYNCRHLKVNIMKDPMTTLRTAIKKRQMYSMVNKIVLVLFCFFIYFLICTYML